MSGAAAGGACPPGRCHATTCGAAAASGVSRRSNRWPAAKPAPPVTRTRGPEGDRATLASERRSPGVLRLVVGLERGVLFPDRAPPPLVLPVPGDRLGQALLEVVLRAPAEPLQLRGVERVAAIVAGPIADRLDQRRGPSDEIEQPVGEVDVLHLVAAADVVDLARL